MTEETQIKIVNREHWLTEAVELFRPYYVKHKYEIPKVLVSCGFPSSGGLAENRTRGQCWSHEVTFDGSHQIFISPLESEPLDVLGILSHELTHAALPSDAKHGKLFKDAMKELGLGGKTKSAMPVEAPLVELVNNIADQLGEYPNSAIRPKQKTTKDKASTKKTFKLVCEKKRNCEKGCLLLDKQIEKDYELSLGKKMIELGYPFCPCNFEMTFTNDEEYELYRLAVQDDK